MNPVLEAEKPTPRHLQSKADSDPFKTIE